jgi:surface polysaccharide O-acyltransferase-like enzyme
VNKQVRLTGIDLFRGIAIFAVIVLHSDESLIDQPWGWSTVLQFSEFAVPYFLATSFYLAIAKSYETKKAYPLVTRLTRLFLPYIVWTGIYLFYKSTKYLVFDGAEQVLRLFSDPVALIFFGGAAFQLYFLPLLITGTILLKGFERWIQHPVRPRWLFLLLLASLIGYELLLSTSNNFRNQTGTAFNTLTDMGVLNADNSLIRVGLVAVAWIIRCLPYILSAMLVCHPQVQSQLPRFKLYYLVMAIASVIGLNVFGKGLLPESLYEVTMGYGVLLIAILTSYKLKNLAWIRDLGACSFGIYLIHLLLVEVFQIISNRLLPVHMENLSSLALLLAAFSILILSWLIVHLLNRQKQIARILWGA